MALRDKQPFTPIIEPLARERGLVSAAVFGIVQRHCKMVKGVCDASLETMAEMIGSDRSTVLRHIKKLCEAGYLKDLTPNLRNSPHIYEDTGKVDLMAQIDNGSDKSISMRNSLDNASDKSVAHNNSSMQTVAHSNTSKDGSYNSVAESHLKIESSSLESYPNKESLQDSSPNGEEGDKPPPLPVEPKSVKVEYTPFMREFLMAFNAKRFKNDTQAKTIAGLTTQFGEPKLRDLIEWAANKGMGLGDAVASINSALTKPKPQKNGANHGTYQNTNRKGIKALEETGESLRQNRTTDTSTREYVYPDGHREPIPPVPRVPRRGLLPS